MDSSKHINLCVQQQKIPPTLFPQDKNKYSLHWGKDTFVYAHLFNPSLFPSSSYGSDAEAVKWKNVAESMFQELQQEGYKHAQMKILELAKEDYSMKMPNVHDQAPVSYEDVISTIASKEWYNNNKNLSRKQLWFMQYGIYRNDYDDWLRNVERSWLAKHNVTYLVDSRTSNNVERACVYKIMSKFAGGKISDRFISVTKTNHNEYVSCRNKSKPGDDDKTYTQIQMSRFHGYLVEVDQQPDIIMNLLTPDKQHIRKVRVALQSALHGGVEVATLEKLVRIEFRKHTGKCNV